MSRLSSTPAASAAESSHAQDNGSELGNLPNWDLSDLYQSPNAPEIERDFNAAERLAEDFAKDFEGQLSGASAQTLADAIKRYESFSELAGRIMSYAGLRYHSDTSDPEVGKFLGDAQARLTEISGRLVFFTLELNRIDENDLAAMMDASAELARYRPWLDRVRAMRPHQLSDELEKFLHDQSVVGSSAWVRLFDDSLAAMRFDVDGEAVPLEAALNRLTDADRNKRETAAHTLAAKFNTNSLLFTRVMNTIIKEQEIEDRWRKLPTPQSARHLGNHVEPEVVDALRDAVRANYPRLSHRYYALKAKWLGLDALEYWDRNAPLPEKDDRVIPWNEARDTILEAYGGFDPKMADLARKFFDRGWIDAPVRAGKASGAFAHPTVTTAHPYVLVNYLGKTRDVMTLAHELGHGVHQLLAAEQGELLSSTPLTLAETASVFGEMLTFQSLRHAEHGGSADRVLRFRGASS